jgi:hypothetical protein
VSDQLKAAYTKLISMHYAAVQTDTKLDHAENDRYFKLEKTSKLFWEQFHAAEKKFLDLMETYHD